MKPLIRAAIFAFGLGGANLCAGPGMAADVQLDSTPLVPQAAAQPPHDLIQRPEHPINACHAQCMHTLYQCMVAAPPATVALNDHLTYMSSCAAEQRSCSSGCGTTFQGVPGHPAVSPQ